MKRLLARIGIGGFYLYVTYDMPGRNKEIISGPYRFPYNPYQSCRLYSMSAKTRYHLRAPRRDIQKPLI